MLIDTHAHLNFKEFNNEIPQILKRADDADVKAIINVGSNYETSKKAVEIANKYNPNLRIYPNTTNNSNKPNKLKSYPSKILRAGKLKANIYASVGCHPIHLVKDIVEEAKFDGRVYKFKTKQEFFNYGKYKKLAQSSDKVVAIGETGLDYYRLDDSSNFQFSIFPSTSSGPLWGNFQSNFNDTILKYKNIQKKVFEEHIRLAEELKLPLILHCRGSENNPYDAYDEMLKILNSSFIIHNSEFKGVIHCFGGNLKQAKEFIKLGFYIGITGIVTFKNARELKNIVKDCPLRKILAETDCPFLAPTPYRGKRNEPAYVVEVARKISELKDIPLKEVEQTTTQNAIDLFKLSTN